MTTFKKTEDTGSGPNPGDFPIISLIDDTGLNYYDNVLQNINRKPFRASPTVNPSTFPTTTIVSSTPELINSLYSNINNNFDTSFSQNSVNNINPYYAPEEFTYNQDPILIDHSDGNSVGQSFQEVKEDPGLANVQGFVDEEPREEIQETPRKSQLLNSTPTLIPTFFEEIEEIAKKTEKSSRSLTAQDVFRIKRVKASELTHLVNTIEYQPPEQKTNSLSEKLDNIARQVKCPELKERGFCEKDASYPLAEVLSVVSNCSSIMSSFSAFIPEDLDSLGDNSASIISSEKDANRPWSWTVSAFSKRQVCDSHLSFVKPSYVLDSRGKQVQNSDNI